MTQLHDADLEAASAAWAILRFEQAALPPVFTRRPADDDTVTLFPTGRAIPLANVPMALRDLRKPVVLASLSAQGLIGVWSVEDAATDARAKMEREFANQEAVLQSMCRQLELGPDARVLIETPQESRILPMNVVARLVRDYWILVAWSLKKLWNDPRADASLVFSSASGTQSPGWRRTRQ